MEREGMTGPRDCREILNTVTGSPLNTNTTAGASVPLLRSQSGTQAQRGLPGKGWHLSLRAASSARPRLGHARLPRCQAGQRY